MERSQKKKKSQPVCTPQAVYLRYNSDFEKNKNKNNNLFYKNEGVKVRLIKYNCPCTLSGEIPVIY